jgi:hypothetical protein
VCRRVALLLALTLFAVLASAGPLSSATQPFARQLQSVRQPQSVRWLLYGDSLSEQSGPYLAHSGTVGRRYFGGTAPCNWVSNLPVDLAEFTPSKVLLEFIGNLPPCMSNRDPQTGYEQDLTKIVTFWKTQGVPVVMVISPPTPTDQFAWARSAELHVASQLGLPVSDAGQSVLTDTGQFAFFLPCQTSETPALGCGAENPGEIRVRNADGIHFAKSAYSSGAERFANREAQS